MVLELEIVYFMILGFIVIKLFLYYLIKLLIDIFKGKVYLNFRLKFRFEIKILIEEC